jgi:S1-C subfamily serine protease
VKRLLALILVVLGTACGGAAEPAAHAAAPAQPRKSAKPKRPPAGVLWRDELVRTVEQGLGRFLQLVEVEASLEGGQFQGFRILVLQPQEFWHGVDLKPGDVVTAVNGMPIERETQAYEAFQALKTAKELRVSYLRGGKARELVYQVVDRPKS